MNQFCLIKFQLETLDVIKALYAISIKKKLIL